MYAYEGAFRDSEVQEWLDRQISRNGMTAADCILDSELMEELQCICKMQHY